MNLNKKTAAAAVLSLALGLAACNSGNTRRNPGKAYAMDMTYSKAYDYYQINPNFSDSLTARPPVPGTVARGHALPDHMMENDTSGSYYASFTTGARFSGAELKEGGRLFNIYCAICHGTNMDGQGPLYTSGKFAAMPANLKDAKYLRIPEGQIYHAIKFGKGAMGSYASQVDIMQRWQIIAYIKQYQSKNGGDAFMLGSGDITADISNVVPRNDTNLAAPSPSVPGVDTSKAGSAGAKAERGNRAAGARDNQQLNNARSNSDRRR